jgi:hypothetical protein
MAPPDQTKKGQTSSESQLLISPTWSDQWGQTNRWEPTTHTACMVLPDQTGEGQTNRWEPTTHIFGITWSNQWRADQQVRVSYSYVWSHLIKPVKDRPIGESQLLICMVSRDQTSEGQTNRWEQLLICMVSRDQTSEGQTNRWESATHMYGLTWSNQWRTDQ